MIIFQVYWAGPMSGGVVAALLYYYVLAFRDEPFSQQTQVLFCCGSAVHEPLLEEAKDGSKELV